MIVANDETFVWFPVQCRHEATFKISGHKWLVQSHIHVQYTTSDASRQ